jgi:hypothetical protein
MYVTMVLCLYMKYTNRIFFQTNNNVNSFYNKKEMKLF